MVCGAVRAVAYRACVIYQINVKYAINKGIAPLVGAYCIRPELRGFAMFRWRFAMLFMRRCTGRMQYAPTIIAKRNKSLKCTAVERMMPIRIARICNFVVAVCGAVYAAVYRAYAIHQINVKCAINKGIAPP